MKEEKKWIVKLSDHQIFLDAIHPGHLLLIAGRPGTRKSTLLRTMIASLAESSSSPAIFAFSLEMTKDRWVEQFSADIDNRMPIHGAREVSVDWAHSDILRYDLANQPLYLDDTPGLETTEVVKTVEQFGEIHPGGLVVIDYLQLISQEGSEVEPFTRQLQEIASRTPLCIVLVCNLWRDIDYRDDRTPTLADLKKVGDIESACDTIILLSRPCEPRIWVGYPIEFLPGPTTCRIVKSRSGSLGEFTLDIVETESG